MGNGFMEKLRIGRVRRIWISYHLDINYHVIYCDIDGARIREKVIQILNFKNTKDKCFLICF